MTETITIEYGKSNSFKLDGESVSCLARSQAMLKRELGAWIERDYIVRRALRLYLKYLRLDCKSVSEEREELIKVIGGEE